MKFTCTTVIDAPVSKVVTLYTDPESMKESQDGFIRKENLEGPPWEVGSKSRIIYEKLELVETILISDLPAEFKALYEHKHMVNTMYCKFTALDNATTRFDQEIHYTKFIGFIPKLMARLFPGLFKKQVQKWLDKFKIFVEKETRASQSIS